MDSAKASEPHPEDDVCPAAPLLTLLRGRWTASLIHHLGNRGTMRFGALQRALTGISPKVLTERLRGLERHGLVWREATDDVPPQVSYGLSEKGVDVHAALASFEATGPARAGRCGLNGRLHGKRQNDDVLGTLSYGRYANRQQADDRFPHPI